MVPFSQMCDVAGGWVASWEGGRGGALGAWCRVCLLANSYQALHVTAGILSYEGHIYQKFPKN